LDVAVVVAAAAAAVKLLLMKYIRFQRVTANRQKVISFRFD